MKHMRKLIMLALLAALLFVLPAMAQAASSGTCGENLTWTLDDAGVLTISGTGEMTDYSYSSPSPWGKTVKQAIIKEGVTSIGDCAFMYCSKLTNITLPDGVTSIGDDAFYDCISLTSITLPEGVTSIGYYAFARCSSLTSVTIPEGVSSIGRFTFSGCESLASVTIPEGVTSIGYYAFAACGSLASVMLPESVTSIGDWAFERCSSLANITIPEGVTSIGQRAFEECISLTSITIPEGVTSIDSCVFYGCESLASVTIPEGVISIGPRAFEECISLTSITIPEGVTSIDSYVFYGCESLASVTIPEGVTSIGDFAFTDCSSLANITIPEGVTSIGNGTFYNCSNLVGVTLPESVTSIGSSAFYECSSLASVTLPEGVISIGHHAFKGCISLTSVTIPEGVTSIGDWAFYGCISLASVTLPEGVTSIGKGAFSGCESLASITLPDHIATISADTFAEGTTIYAQPDSITAVALTNAKLTFVCPEAPELTFSVTENADGVRTVAVVDCAEDAAVCVIPAGVTVIKSKAFDNCASLTSITIPDSVTKVGYNAFGNCEAVRYANINSPAALALWNANNGSYHSYYTYCKIGHPEIALATYSSGVCSIRSIAADVTDVVIPDGVTIIDDDIFRNSTRYTSITIPDSVTEVEWGAFNGCSAVLYADRMGSAALVLSSAGCSFTDTEYPDLSLKAGESSEGVRSFTVTGCVETATSVSWPENVTSIGGSAFKGCTGLTSIAIPEGVTSIGGSAFSGCTGLTGITIPEGVTSIGGSAFDGCSNLASVTIPDGVTSVGNLAFRSCPAIRYANMGSEAALALGKAGYTFAVPGCPELTLKASQSTEGVRTFAVTDCAETAVDVVIPEGVTSIGDYAFRDCSSLVSVSIPEGVTSLGYYAFGGCSSLAGITIPKGVTSIDDYTFYNCSSLTGIVLPEGVVSIGYYAFGGCSSLASVTLPEGMTSIGSMAFYNCRSLVSIVIPDSVSSVDSSTFGNCPAIRYASMESDAALALGKAGCSFVDEDYPELKLKVTQSAEGVKTITVTDCAETAVKVVIPEGVTSIGQSAFRGCSNLAEVILPESLETIEDYAFYDCPKLSGIILPESLTTIEEYAFAYCKNLTTIEIPGSVTVIGKGAFRSCSNLLSITLNEGLTTIDDYAFEYCKRLEDIQFPSTLTSIGTLAFNYCTGLTSVTIPGGVSGLPFGVFSGCDNISTVTFNEGVTSIGTDAFTASLKVVYLPNSMAKISTDALWGRPTIYCYEYSYAESWAIANKYKHVLLDGKPGSSYTTVSLPANTLAALGTPVQLKAEIFPESTGQAETWTSSNPGVATVDATGLLTPLQAGTTTITLTVNGVSGSGTVTVAPALTVFSLPETVYVISKTTDVLPLSIAPANAARDLIYAVGDSNYAAIDVNGQVKAGGIGMTTLTVIDRVSGKLLNADLCVTYPVSAISFAEPAVTAPVGTATRLTANVTMRTDSCVNQLVTFASSNPAVAVVDQHGYVTGVSQGSAVITATAASGVSASCTVTVVMADTLMLPESLKVIGDEAFAGMSAERVVIPRGCTTIGSRAFANSARLTIIYMPDTVTSIAADAFEGCVGVTFLCESQNAAYQFAQANGIACQVE